MREKIDFEKFGLDEKYNFLSVYRSKEHGEAYMLHSDPWQLGAGLISNLLSYDAIGMVIIIKGDKMGFVMSIPENHRFLSIAFEKRSLEEAGEVFNLHGADYWGMLIDCGCCKDGQTKYKVLSNSVNVGK